MQSFPSLDWVNLLVLLAMLQNLQSEIVTCKVTGGLGLGRQKRTAQSKSGSQGHAFPAEELRCFHLEEGE
jgi:hypothetical protein